ncbi:MULTISPECIES: ABC transporter permease [Micromonospora]|uniref:Transport permease protein n=1 Tax=Micromonospora yangpuensis TaxID=683228 RepID=A0A1C6UL58_9ACTN|nr:ABC transporter permease [Micromonospora yangpuensis]GGM17705.1 transport permease protein [Micromonospora yangpuensis]SCL54815.1 ABC-2 type transport system permease protein [Micromonospora yangpuensis]
MSTDAVAGDGALRRIAAVAVRHWFVTRRSPHRFLDIAVWPVFDMLLYGSIAMYVRQAGGDAATRTALSVVAGIVMWHVVYQSQIAVSSSFFEEIYARQLPSLLTTPLRPVEWVAGAAVQGLVRVGVGIAAVTAAAAVLFGFDLTGTGGAIVPVMALLLLTGWAIALIVMGVVMFLGTGTETLAFTLLFIMLPLSGAFYPVSVLPAWIQPVSAVLPTTYTFSAARAVATGDPAPWGEIGVAALATAALMAAAFGFAAFALRVFQRRGFVSRYQ